VAGGNIAEAFGWRAAFLALGVPGIGLALIVRFTMREPPRGGEPASSSAAGTPLRETLRFIRGQRSLLHTLAGATIVTYWDGGCSGGRPLFSRARII